MAQPRDPRSRFHPVSILEYHRGGRSASSFNDRAHVRDRHGQHIHHLLYTSKATLDLVTGTPFYPTTGGRIVGFRLSVKTAPVTTALQVNVLLDGTTIFDGDFVEVAAGSTFGYRKAPNDKIYFYPDKKLEVDVQTISSAGGPLVLDIEFIPG